MRFPQSELQQLQAPDNNSSVNHPLHQPAHHQHMRHNSTQYSFTGHQHPPLYQQQRGKNGSVYAPLDIDGIFNRAADSSSFSGGEQQHVLAAAQATTSPADASSRSNSNSISSSKCNTNNIDHKSSNNGLKPSSSCVTVTDHQPAAASQGRPKNSSDITGAMGGETGVSVDNVSSPGTSSSRDCSPQCRGPVVEMQWSPPVAHLLQKEPLPRMVDCGNGHFFCWSVV